MFVLTYTFFNTFFCLSSWLLHVRFQICHSCLKWIQNQLLLKFGENIFRVLCFYKLIWIHSVHSTSFLLVCVLHKYFTYLFVSPTHSRVVVCVSPQHLIVGWGRWLECGWREEFGCKYFLGTFGPSNYAIDGPNWKCNLNLIRKKKNTKPSVVLYAQVFLVVGKCVRSIAGFSKPLKEIIELSSVDCRGENVVFLGVLDRWWHAV